MHFVSGWVGGLLAAMLVRILVRTRNDMLQVNTQVAGSDGTVDVLIGYLRRYEWFLSLLSRSLLHGLKHMS